MQKCDICNTEGHYKLRHMGNQTWACSKCIYTDESHVHSVKARIKVGSMWATQKQLDEMERRVILPYDKPGGGYYLGRRGENGKVQERPPDYSY